MYEIIYMFSTFYWTYWGGGGDGGRGARLIVYIGFYVRKSTVHYYYYNFGKCSKFYFWRSF